MKNRLFLTINCIMTVIIFLIVPNFCANAQSDGLTVSRTMNSITASWSKDESADVDYNVYLYGSGGTLLQKSEGNKGSSYTFSNLSSATYYKVTLCKNIYDEEGSLADTQTSETSTKTLPYVTSLSVKSYTADSITLNIGSVRCDGYQIQYSKSADFSASSYITSSGTTCTISGLSCAQKYYFRVRAFTSSPSGYGNFSSTVCQITKPAQMKIGSTSSPSTSKIKVKYSKVTATKYQIQISQKKDFSSSKSYYVEQSTKSKTISGLKKGKTYYIRIRAHITFNNYDIAGSWSSVKKQKIYTEKKVTVKNRLMKKSAWDSKTLCTVKKGEKVRYIGKSGRWYKVIYDGKTGYMYNLSFKKKGSSNLKRSKVTSSNYKTYLDDVIFKIGKSDKAIYNYVKNNMTYSKSKISKKQRRANINSLSDIYKIEDELVAVAIKRKGGICYNYAALAKALYDRVGGHDIYFVYGHGKYGVHCWIVDKTSKGYRYTDVKRKAYFYTKKQFKTRSNTKDLKWKLDLTRPEK